MHWNLHCRLHQLLPQLFERANAAEPKLDQFGHYPRPGVQLPPQVRPA